MISRIARWAVPLVALASSLAVLSSSATAVTWHNTGNTAFTATGTSATFTVGTNNMSCFGASARGTAAGGSTSGFTYSIPGTLTYSPCTLAGQLTYVHCGFTLTGTTQPINAVTSGNADLNCVARLTATNTALCNIVGQTPFTYFNANLPAVGGYITFTSSFSLTASHSSGTSCLLGTGFVSLTHHTLAITSGTGGSGTHGPILTRTA
jgi:hypothetical protein